MKGVIVGTKGVGNGLDDEEMDDVFAALEENNLAVFVHPHYGVGDGIFEGCGHALKLALGFPFETSAAASRFIISGGLDRTPNLKMILAHCGGTLPFLAGRLDSCVVSDEHVAPGSGTRVLQNVPSFYLKKLYYDALGYNASTLKCLLNLVGPERIMFGTDNPFFPPSDGELFEKPWKSVTSNYDAVYEAGLSTEEEEQILASTAVSILGLKQLE
jgi:predicted TIM-barrel fold metal-dependent hydrolase